MAKTTVTEKETKTIGVNKLSKSTYLTSTLETFAKQDDLDKTQGRIDNIYNELMNTISAEHNLNDEFTKFREGQSATNIYLNSKVKILQQENIELKQTVEKLDIKCNVFAIVSLLGIAGIILSLIF